MLWGGGRWVHVGAAVGAGERLRMGHGDMLCGGGRGASGSAALGSRFGIDTYIPLRGGKQASGVLQWARENGCDWDSDTCSSAAQGGHLGVLQWARENGCEWNYMTCCAAAEGGHLGVL